MRLEHQQVTIGARQLHVVTSGDPKAPPFVFLHGWPESWVAWHDVMAAADHARCIAIDLPGIGASRGMVEGGRKLDHAKVVHELVDALGLQDVTLVGHDAGGMIAYAYLRAFTAKRVVIVNTVIPGIDPWDKVIANPYDWHWAFHATPQLPEMLVRGRELGYFDFFYSFLSADASRITPERRAMYAEAYSSDEGLRSGFDLYRGMTDDAKANRETITPCETPLLYIRGDNDKADIAEYAAGFRKAGVTNVETKVISKSGHFIADEQPTALWEAIA